MRRNYLVFEIFRFFVGGGGVQVAYLENYSKKTYLISDGGHFGFTNARFGVPVLIIAN